MEYGLADTGLGIYTGSIENVDALAIVSSIAADISKNEKPLYLSMMMSKNQVEQIINHSYLFDSDLVNAAKLVLDFYDNAQVSYTE